MKQKKFWLRALNVRSYEGNLVKKLFLLQFFQGAGIAFFFTAAFALFLSRIAITAMPMVFIYSSLMLWAAGFLYARIEHKFHISNLAIFVTVFMTASILFFRIAYIYTQADWFLYCMLAWFNVLYLLNNLEFWGLASVLFDVRQSKRLFGVISAGDIPAKFIGYTLALLSVQYIGTINLLLIGVACLLASIPFLVSIKKNEMLTETQHTHAHVHTHAAGEVSKIVRDFSVNTLIRRLAALSIIITGSLILINFAFYAGVKEAYHDDVSLAKFIAFFLAIVRIIALIIKTIFTSRLINRLGIIKSLLITPVALLLLIISIVLTQDMADYQKVILYLFGATYIVVDILRSAIASPVFLTIMQPLSSHERLRAHTIVKGIMDPFASLVAGVLLLLIIRLQHRVDLLTISYMLLVVCVLWIIGIFRVNNQYLVTILKTLSSRYFNLENFSVSDSSTLAWLQEKINTGSETEVINIINMLYQANQQLSEDIVRAALEHPSDNVKKAILQLMQQKNFPAAPALLLPFLQQHNNPVVIAPSIRILARNGAGFDIIQSYLKSNEPVIRQAALGGLYFFGTGEYKANAAAILKQMMLSGHTADRLMVAEIISSPDQCTETAMILRLMNDKDAAVRKPAFTAAGKSHDATLLRGLLDKMATDETASLQALYIAGSASLPLLQQEINHAGITRLQCEKLIRLTGRIGGGQAQQFLLQLLLSKPGYYPSTIKALYRSNYTARQPQQPALIATAKKILLRSAGIIYMQSTLEKDQQQYQLLINSFRLELNSLRESLLYLFAMLYNRENINKVRKAYASGKKDSIMNAMEIIDITVRKDLSLHFNTIFEPGNIDERLHGLREIYPVEFFSNTSRILTRILADDTRFYNNWTMACSLYTSKKQQHEIDTALIEKYIEDESILLRETASFAL